MDSPGNSRVPGGTVGARREGDVRSGTDEERRAASRRGTASLLVAGAGRGSGGRTERRDAGALLSKVECAFESPGGLAGTPTGGVEAWALAASRDRNGCVPAGHVR